VPLPRWHTTHMPAIGEYQSQMAQTMLDMCRVSRGYSPEYQHFPASALPQIRNGIPTGGTHAHCQAPSFFFFCLAWIARFRSECQVIPVAKSKPPGLRLSSAFRPRASSSYPDVHGLELLAIVPGPSSIYPLFSFDCFCRSARRVEVLSYQRNLLERLDTDCQYPDSAPGTSLR
jgi:hypothetical protein